jgi:hypothetical protein
VPRPLRALAISSALLLGACGPSAAPAARDYPGPLRPPAAYDDDFAIDQTVTAIHAEGSETFRAVIEKRDDELVIVGLGPHGGRGFVLTQRGDEVTFESQLPRELPFPPRYVLLDIHRAWLLGLPDPPLADGEHRAEIDGEEIAETWADGRLLARAFRRLDGQPPGTIRITYHGGLSPDLLAPAPSGVELDNAWFGYRLVIEGISRRPL